MSIHVSYDLTINQIPRECIKDCSQPGPADATVAYWREQLGFTVDRDRAVRCLKGYGAWDGEELAAMSDEDIAEIILWLACGNFSEYATEAADAGFDGYTGARPDDFDPSCGSDLFVLE